MPVTEPFQAAYFSKCALIESLIKFSFPEWRQKAIEEAYGDWRMANGFDLVDPLISGEPSVTYFDVHHLLEC